MLIVTFLDWYLVDYVHVVVLLLVPSDHVGPAGSLLCYTKQTPTPKHKLPNYLTLLPAPFRLAIHFWLPPFPLTESFFIQVAFHPVKTALLPPELAYPPVKWRMPPAANALSLWAVSPIPQSYAETQRMQHVHCGVQGVSFFIRHRYASSTHLCVSLYRATSVAFSGHAAPF